MEVAGGCFCCRFPDLLAAIRELQATAAPEFILAEPVGSCTDLAATVGVNESTVVRFAAGLGLKGYPGLTLLCREKLSEDAQLLRRFTNVEQHSRDGDDPLELAAAFDQANVARTLARIDADTWSATVAALKEALVSFEEVALV